MAARRRSLVRIVLAWAFLTLAWCAFVIVLAGRLHAQEPCPPGTISVDRYGFLCLPGTAEAFGDVAGHGHFGKPAAIYKSGNRFRGLSQLSPSFRVSNHAAATPRIILARDESATGIFVDVARGGPVYPGRVSDEPSFRPRIRVSGSVVTDYRSARGHAAATPRIIRITRPEYSGDVATQFLNRQGATPQRYQAATPRIILAHQKLASDGVVLAHDEYDWINRGGYRNKQGEHCCGKDDCFKLRPDEVKEVPGGYEVPSHGVTVPHQDAMPSEDGNYWICRTSAKFRCFFRPYSGS